MSKKFTPPQRFKKLRKIDKNIDDLMEWYENKLRIMEKRQEMLSNKLTKAYKTINI